MRIIGHEYIMEAFVRAQGQEQRAHAYLFTGPTHTGKSTLALWMAQRLLCTARGTQDASTREVPCGDCARCIAVVRGVHPDVFRVLGSSLPVEDLRSWLELLAASSLFAGWKIGIVEESDRMQEAAANACLKFLEEPPQHTLLMFTATHSRRVLRTIASRCAIVRCTRVPVATIIAGLVARGVTLDDASAAAAASDGCPGSAIRFTQDASAREVYEKHRTDLAMLVVGSPTQRIRAIEAFTRQLPNQRNEARRELEQIVDELRRVVMERLRKTPWEAVTYTDVLQRLARAPVLLAANVSSHLVLESIALAHP